MVDWEGGVDSPIPMKIGKTVNNTFFMFSDSYFGSKIVIIFFSNNVNIRFGCSKESSHVLVNKDPHLTGI